MLRRYVSLLGSWDALVDLRLVLDEARQVDTGEKETLWPFLKNTRHTTEN